jgi:hypothetical protein
MPQSYTNLIDRLVFAAKHRQPSIDDAVKSRLYDYIGGTIRRRGGIAPAINAVNNHVKPRASARGMRVSGRGLAR